MTTRAGIVALVGRPNVGKSTLLNALIGSKVSIVSARPQTTRHRVVGVLTRDQDQIVFVDTPGQADDRGQALNRALDKTARAAMADVDLVIWVLEAGRFKPADERIGQRLPRGRFGIVLSKIDRIAERKRLLPELQRLQQQFEPRFIVPLSGLKRENLDALLGEIGHSLEPGPWLYPPDEVDPQAPEFIAAERVREQLFRRLREELPYRLTVSIEEMIKDEERWQIRATIWVDSESHKRIVIGAGGEMLKAVGTAARRDLASAFGDKVDLRLWVKVREGWADNEQSLRAFGYRGGD